MGKFKYWFRWIALFPGALIAAILATFPLHWVLYFIYLNSNIFSEASFESTEFTMYPLVIAFTFIFAGYKIAPKYKLKATTMLFIIYFILWTVVAITSIFKDNIYGMYIEFTAKTPLSLLSAIISLYIVKKIDNKKNN